MLNKTPFKMKNIYCLFFLLLISSCNSTQEKKETKHKTNTLIKYAKGFDIQEYNNYYKLIIKSPFKDTTTTYEYILVKKNSVASAIVKKGVIIKIPIERVVTTSTSHIPMLEILDVENTLVGFPNMNYISSKKTRERIDNGLVKEIGVDANLNTEVVLELHPDLIIGFSVNGSNKSLEALKRLGINVIYNGAWLEETPLGRAEWIKFFGVLFDKMELSDSLFQKIEVDYKASKELASKSTNKPSVLSGSMFKDVWNVPAGKSFVAHFLKDANSNYLWNDTSGHGSLQLNFENVFDKGQEADLWIGCGGFISKEEMISLNPLYAKFKSYKRNNIYTFSKKKGTTGGTLYFELAPTRPDLVLKDLIKIAHPELLPTYKMTFFNKLN